MTADLEPRYYARTALLLQYRHCPETLVAAPGADPAWRFTDYLMCGWCGTRFGMIYSHWVQTGEGLERRVDWHKPPGFRAERNQVWELGQRARNRRARGQKFDYHERYLSIDLAQPAAARCPLCQRLQVLDASRWVLSSDLWREQKFPS